MGKPKKGKKKANDDWEDDVLSELGTLKDGDQGAKKDEAASSQKASRFQALDVEEVNDDNNDDDLSMDTSVGKQKKKDKKKKDNLDSPEESKELPKNGSAQLEPENVNKEMDIDEDDFDMGFSSKKSKKSKMSKKDVDLSELADLGDESTETDKKDAVNKDKHDDDDGEKDDDDDGPVIKTAAQKKAEKKEREKKKKALEKERQKQKAAKKTEKAADETTVDKSEGDKTTEKTTEGSVKDEVKETEPVKEAEQPEEDKAEKGEAATTEKDHAEGEGEDDEAGEGDKKKKKKKKKKKATEEEETKKTKKPNKALVKQMQQQLEQLRLEEERLRQEEEEKIRLLEESEEKRLEKLRVEQERKDKKKLKEKERKARLKQEGKLLTKTEKEKKAKQQAMLEAMKRQGIAIPGLKTDDQEVDVVKKPVRYGTRKKNKPQQQQQQEKEDVEMKVEKQESVESETQPEETVEESEKEKKEEPAVVVPEEVKDAWDLESDEEDTTKSDGKKKSDKEQRKERKKSEGSSADNEEDSGSTSEEEEEDEEEEEEGESEEEDDSEEDSKNETIPERINKRRVRAELNRTTDNLRSPVICVLGHVDTGKTKILDKIRHTHVQDGEAGGITQQIGATMVPVDAIKTQTKMVKEFQEFEIKVPGLLIIDTPGHESFSNLRSRGSSLCDMAILVVDIMHGLEPQTIESINLLKKKKTPFVVALNKVDRLFEWKRGPDSSIINTIKKQKRNTKQEFEERVSITVKEFAEQGLNACLFYDNKDERSYVSLIPTSAHSGDGMGDLISQIVKLTQLRLAQRLSFSEELEGMILEVKAIPGLGTTIDVILVNGTLREGDTIVVPSYDGPIVTQIRALLTPQPLKELRVKSQYINHKELKGSQGVKLAAKDLEKALAGIPLQVARKEDEIDYCKKEVTKALSDALKSINLTSSGVYVQASTLGSLEALLEFLRVSKIPYSGVNIGPVHKKDVSKCSIMLEHDVQFAVILAFDVKIEREAQELADNLGVTIFSADIIYHLFDKFTSYREEQKMKRRDEFKSIAVFPCKLRVLPQHIYNTRDPIVVGVSIEAGILKEGTPVCVPSKEFVDIGVVTGIEANHKSLEQASKGMEVCIKIEPTGDAPKLYGRHFDYQDLIVSKISRASIDAVKDYFRDDLQKSDWQLMIELKKLFEII